MMGPMRQLLLTVGQIALLRQGPEILPSSRFLLLVSLLLHGAVGLLIAGLSAPLEQALGLSLLGTATMAAFLHLVVILHRCPLRLNQSLTALAATETLIGLLAIPVTLLFHAGGSLKDIGALLSLLLFVWNILLAGHIFRHTLSLSQGRGLLYAIGYVALSLTLTSLAFEGA